MRRKRISAKHPNKDIGLQKKQICQIKLNNPFINAEIAKSFGGLRMVAIIYKPH